MTPRRLWAEFTEGIMATNSFVPRRQTTIPPTTKAFQQFSKLPLELQMLIWKHALELKDPMKGRSELHAYAHTLCSFVFPTARGFLPNKISAVKDVCLLSRLLHFETWREAFRDCVVPESDVFYCRKEEARMRDGALKVLGARIVYLRRRIADWVTKGKPNGGKQ